MNGATVAPESEAERPGLLGRIRARLAARWARLRARHPSVRHSAEAWHRLQDSNGSQYAGAITYFSFLALFPLLLLAVSVVGFVLHAHPAAQASLFSQIEANFPGQFGDTLKTSIDGAIKARAGVGAIGLVGVLLAGLGWIGNLRAAIDAVWGVRGKGHNFVVAKVMNLLVLAGLGIAVLISLGLTVAGTALTDQILRWGSMDTVPGVHVLLKLVGVLLAVLGDVLVFWWLLVRLPAARVSRGTALRGAVLASVGFEVLKIVGTYTVAHTANSATAGPFAGVLAVLIWIQLVARFMLFCVAWMATLNAERTARVEPEARPVPMAVPAPESPALSPAAVGASLVGAGAVAGAALTWAVTGRRGQGERSHRRR